MADPLVVAVLMGGPSEEHAISLKSGHGVSDALGNSGFTVEPLVVPREAGREEALAWVRRELLRARPDVVFITLHGAFGEDGTVQALCDEMGFSYTGSDAAASRVGMDKLASRARFAEAGLTVPRWIKVSGGSWKESDLAGLAYPMVVKPVDQGSSIGVSLVKSAGEIKEAIRLAAQYGDTVLIDEYVRGRELTVGVLGSKTLPAIEVVPKHVFFDFSAKYTAGLTEYRVPAELPEAVAKQVQAVGWRAHQALGCRHLSRTDLILDDAGRSVVLEVNTIPGFTPTSLLPKAAACAGISYAALCEQLVAMAAKRPRRAAGVSARR